VFLFATQFQGVRFAPLFELLCQEDRERWDRLDWEALRTEGRLVPPLFACLVLLVFLDEVVVCFERLCRGPALQVIAIHLGDQGPSLRHQIALRIG